MNRNRTKYVLALAVVALAVFATPPQAGALEGQLGILTPGTLAGNNPATGAPWAVGDNYRFAFITSEKRTLNKVSSQDKMIRKANKIINDARLVMKSPS